MFSGGAGSAYVARHMVETYGKENCILFFTNTLWEDEDNYRFMDEVANYIGIEITHRMDGRTPEEVFYDTVFSGMQGWQSALKNLKLNKQSFFWKN